MSKNSASARPRRSVLYMPGSNSRALEKAKSLPADGLILDLEDAVAPDAKEEARGLVVEAVRAGGYGSRELIIRTNGLDTEWGEADVLAAATSGADAILLPKVETKKQIVRCKKLMKQAGAPKDMTIWCMMETPKGILNANKIAGAHRRVECLVMGTSDLAKDLHAEHTKERLPMLTSLGLCLLAGRSHGCAVIDGVHLDLQDDEGHAISCRRGAELGFDGKTIIHPKQLAVANEAFAPSEKELAWSAKIIEAHAAAAAEGLGIVVVDGRLVENLHVENAQRVVAMAEAIGALEADAASAEQAS